MSEQSGKQFKLSSNIAKQLIINMNMHQVETFALNTKQDKHKHGGAVFGKALTHKHSDCGTAVRLH